MPLNNPPVAISSHVKTESRLLTDASGDVAYTGYGFVPRGLIIFAYKDTDEFSFGQAEPGRSGKAMYFDNGVTYMRGVSALVRVGAGDNQSAIVKSYDIDGFTLTWTKTSTPTGTATLYVVAFK